MKPKIVSQAKLSLRQLRLRMGINFNYQEPLS